MATFFFLINFNKSLFLRSVNKQELEASSQYLPMNYNVIYYSYIVEV